MNIKEIIEQSKSLQKEITMLPGIIVPKSTSNLPELHQIVTDNGLYKSISKLFNDGHHAEAVKKAYVYLNNHIKRQTKSTADGASLMRNTFSPKKPILMLNTLSSQSEEDEQLGYMDIMAGAMTGIRNPRVHEHDWEDTEERALQLLSLANHLLLRAKASSNPSKTTTT